MIQQTKTDRERFVALSRICLNNWHYISRKTLSFSEEINFFTGHSGSGKSTVIDAMQIVLYANTDGRGFFNKAAADDSDRSLIEYLRGMVNIGENNEFAYLRNRNFSTTIVLELKQTDTAECQCVGIVFDVETASNEISRKFFWHKGPLWENNYRTEGRAMTIAEVEEELLRSYGKEECFYTSHNERFRRLLYDVYLGGLDQEKFPLLFKRAIPFRMNIKLEDFVKEYICMEQDIHIEDMQESVMQYGRMRQKIEDTCREIEELKELAAQYREVQAQEEQIRANTYFMNKMEIMNLRLQVSEISDRIGQAASDLDKQEVLEKQVVSQAAQLKLRSDELLRQIASTGYDELKDKLFNLNELLEHLSKSADKWQRTAEGLKAWVDEDVTSNQTIWDIEEFEARTIGREALIRLKASVEEMREDVGRQKQEAGSILRELSKREKQACEELSQLKAGNKAYPKNLENARVYIKRRLLEECKRSVEVHVLSDLLDIRNDEWRNAVEGYLAGSKLSLVVAPAYAKTAMEIYGELDRREYWNVAVLDTEKASKAAPPIFENALSKEVEVREDYLRPFIDMLLGKVIKCRGIEELRKNRTGITPDCMLYRNYRLQYINPDHYTKWAYIGKASVKKRIRLLEEEIEQCRAQKKPQEELQKECIRLLGLEKLESSADTYLEWLLDIRQVKEKTREKKRLEDKLLKLKEQNIDEWEKEREAVEALRFAKEEEIRETGRQIDRSRDELERYKKEAVWQQGELSDRERSFTKVQELEDRLDEFLSKRENPRLDKLGDYFKGRAAAAAEARDRAFEQLLGRRLEYLKRYPNRSFSPSAKDNAAYDKLLDTLSCDNLEHYREAAAEQAKTAVEHFKDDFMYKIRSAIREAVQRKDELNRIISSLNFGKDKYQFVIGRNRGADGRFYDMFMDEALEVNPSKLSQTFENQMNFFTMEHENQYGEQINELINIFIPPENASAEEMEEARRNMDKYADYRTYLSFDMQQIIKNDDGIMKLQLSKMIKKNSGGEGQNPLYVALLASFAQAYRIGLPPKLRRSPTIRLVVLDEAFSKMDAEKVASCIQLIRDLGFQAIISATNDKIQNYVENVNKTFVFANSNKKAISIREFEREEMPQLMKGLV